MALTLERTRAALNEFDRTALSRQRLFNVVHTDKQIVGWAKLEEEAKEKVRRAFHEDTKDYNTWEQCAQVDINSLRQLQLGTWTAPPSRTNAARKAHIPLGDEELLCGTQRHMESTIDLCDGCLRKAAHVIQALTDEQLKKLGLTRTGVT
jgi:hypothetical protein